MSNFKFFDDAQVGVGIEKKFLDNEDGDTEIPTSYVKTPLQVSELIRNREQFFSESVFPGQPLTIGQVKCAVYAYLDVDGQVLYVGQTREGLQVRDGRHLTGQRSDAVGKHLLDPMEVVYIQVWLLPQYQTNTKGAAAHLNALEYEVWRAAILTSTYGFVFNEKQPKKPTRKFEIPKPRTAQLLSDEVVKIVLQPDLRNSRNAENNAAISRIIAQRDVDPYYLELLEFKLERAEHLYKVNKRKRAVA